MIHSFEQQTIDKYLEVFSWDKDVIGKLHVALVAGNLDKVRILMSETEDKLFNQILDYVVDSADINIHNARVKNYKLIRECYSEVEDMIHWYIQEEQDKIMKS